MKLHLPCGLRAALLVCIGGVLASTSWAEQNLVAGEQELIGVSGNLTADGVAAEITALEIVGSSSLSTLNGGTITSGELDHITRLTDHQDATWYWDDSSLKSSLTLTGDVKLNVSKGGLRLHGATLEIGTGAELTLGGLRGTHFDKDFTTQKESSITISGGSLIITGSGCGNLAPMEFDEYQTTTLSVTDGSFLAGADAGRLTMSASGSSVSVSGGAMTLNGSKDGSSLSVNGAVSVSGGTLTTAGSVSAGSLSLTAGKLLLGGGLSISGTESISLTGGTLAVAKDISISADVILGNVTLGGEEGYTQALTFTGNTVFAATATNNGTLALEGALSLAESCSLETEAHEGYSEGANGYIGGTRYYLVQEGSAEGTKQATVKPGATIGDSKVLTSGGNVFYVVKDVAATDYYINENTTYTTAGQLGAATSVVVNAATLTMSVNELPTSEVSLLVQNSGTLTITQGEGSCEGVDITLSQGSINTGAFWIGGNGTDGGLSRDVIQLVSPVEGVKTENYIASNDTAFFSSVAGVGNLTITQDSGTDKTTTVYSSMSHTGNLTIQGQVNLGYEAKDGWGGAAALSNTGSLTFDGATTTITAGSMIDTRGNLVIDADSTVTVDGATIGITGEVQIQGGVLTLASENVFVTEKEGERVTTYDTIVRITDGGELRGAKTGHHSFNNLILTSGSIDMATSSLGSKDVKGALWLGGTSAENAEAVQNGTLTAYSVTGANTGIYATISGAGNLSLGTMKDSDVLNLHNTIQHTGTLDLYGKSMEIGNDDNGAASIINDGNVTIHASTVLVGAGSQIDNKGDVIIASGSEVTLNEGASIGNTGKVLVQGGILALGSTGHFATGSGEARTVTADKEIIVSQSGTLRLELDNTLGNLTLNGGTLDMDTKSFGSQTDRGAIVLQGTANTIKGGNSGIYATITGSGTLNLVETNMQLNLHNTIEHQGNIVFQGDVFSIGNDWGQAGTVKNTGDVSISSGTVTVNYGSLENTGNINLSGGQLVVDSSYTKKDDAQVYYHEKAVISNNGNILVSGTGSLWLKDKAVLDLSAADAGKGRVLVSGGSLKVESGASFKAQGVELSGTGVMNVSSAALESSVTAGAATVTGAGDEAATYTHVQMTASALSGTAQDASLSGASITIAAGGEYAIGAVALSGSQVHVSGSLTLNGTSFESSSLHVASTGSVTAENGVVGLLDGAHSITLGSLSDAGADGDYTLMSTSQLSGILLSGDAYLSVNLGALAEQLAEDASLGLVFSGLSISESSPLAVTAANIQDSGLSKYFVLEGTREFCVSGVGTDGENTVLYIQAVPEPATATLSLLALAALAARRRRK